MSEPTVFKGVKRTELTQLIESKLGSMGRSLGASKSLYLMENENCKPYFDACIFDDHLTQVWWGDIDLIKDKEILDEIAKYAEQPFFITRQSFRHDYNTITFEQIMNNDTIIKFNYS